MHLTQGVGIGSEYHIGGIAHQLWVFLAGQFGRQCLVLSFRLGE